MSRTFRMTDAKDGKDAGTHTVIRALRILSCFTEDRPEWTMAEISKELNLNQSTIGRLVATLESVEYLQRHPDTGRLRVGLPIAGLAFVGLNQVEMRRVSLPVLEELTRLTNLSSTLAVPVGDHAMYIARVEAASSFSANYVLGRMAPLHCSAVGKVLLAHAEAGRQAGLVSGITFTAYTSRTIGTVAGLQAELAECLDCGFARDHGEWLEDVSSVAMPVRDGIGAVVAAVAVTGSTARMQTHETAALAEALAGASRRISYSLGYSRAFA